MALFYTYKPALSFIARVWWQADRTRISPFEWHASAHLLKPLWVRFNSGDGEDGYLRIESKDGSLTPWSPLVTRAPGELYDTFWFGVYEKDGSYCFQIRPIHGDVGSNPGPLPWYLDADMVGYMGMYHSWFAVPEWVIYSGSELWKIRGMDLHDLEEGEICPNLEFVDNNDNPVTLHAQSSRTYLYTGSQAAAGLVSLNILKRPYSPEVPGRKKP